MMKGIKYACFSVLSLALLSACSMNQSSESSMDNQPTMNTTTNKNPLVGKDASDFELKDMKGNTVKLSDYKGKKVYLKFWATWCGPCRMQAPILEKLSEELSEDELKILKMDVDENPETARAFGIMSIPTLLFKKDGQVVKQVAGVHTAAQIKDIVAELS